MKLPSILKRKEIESGDTVVLPFGRGSRTGIVCELGERKKAKVRFTDNKKDEWIEKRRLFVIDDPSFNASIIRDLR